MSIITRNKKEIFKYWKGIISKKVTMTFDNECYMLFA